MRLNLVCVWLAIAGQTSASVSLFRRSTNRFQRIKSIVPDDQPSNSTGRGVFQQYISHANKSLGTFSQRYDWSTEYWGGPGRPVIFVTPGESSSDDMTPLLMNLTLTGLYAQHLSAAVIMLEHRYFGSSSPFDDGVVLDARALQHLTLANAMADMAHFARTAALPFDPSGRSSAPRAPWVLCGFSYAGALAAWIARDMPGTFWAYHASSATVQAIDDYWEYFAPIREHMPQNCSADLERVVGHVDAVLMNGTEAEGDALKDGFGLKGLENDDFASALWLALGYWQNQDYVVPQIETAFNRMCDVIEGVREAVNGTIVGTSPGADGIGLDGALRNYASFLKQRFLPIYCNSRPNGPSDLIACLDKHNVSNVDTSSNSDRRMWDWMLCNEPFGWWHDAAPKNQPTIVSRLVTAEANAATCSRSFPTQDGAYTYGRAIGRTVDDVNKFTGGWSETNASRILFVSGEYDPWRPAGVSSEIRPGGQMQSTANTKVIMVEAGFHCPDDIVIDSARHAPTAKAQDDSVAIMKQWIDEFYAAGEVRRRETLHIE